MPWRVTASVHAVPAHFLGYNKGPDGRPQVNPEQARLVRRIYRMFLSGYPMHRIAVTLTDEGVPVPGPRGKKWYTNTIKSILTNEKYRGDALLQKTYISDFLTKKQVKNKGEVAQYYVTGSHEAIIDPETWDLVQYELETRKGKRSPYPFTMKLRCAVCGAWYGSKVWHSTDKYRSVIWQCNNKYRVEHPKPMPHLSTSQIEDAFQAALTIYIRQRPAITTRGANETKEFTPRIWHVLIDHATVEADGAISFTFKDGTTING